MSKLVDREGLKAFREKLDERYVIEGEYSDKTSVGYSDSTGSIKTDYGVELNAGATIDGHLDEPFLFRPTAYPFNRDVITIGGQKATVKQVRAYAFVKNQLLQNPTFIDMTYWNSNETVSVNNNTLFFTSTQQFGSFNHYARFNKGHKYLLKFYHKGTTGNFVIYTGTDGVSFNPNIANVNDDTFVLKTCIVAYTGTGGSLPLICQDNRASGWTEQQFKEFTLIDLTQWFNNDTTILSKTNETWFIPWFLNNFGKYIPTYSTGEIENTYATKITTNGVNQWDGTNDIRVLPKTQYYCKGSATLTYKDIDGNTIDTATVSDAVFTTPDNCIYVGVSGSGDIQICLHWTETEIEQTYHPYEKWVFNIDWSAIGTPLGINSQIGDYKDFVNGKNGKVVGSVDLKTLNWQKSSNNRAYAIVPASANWKIVDAYTLAPMMTANYSIIGYQTLNANPTASDKVIAYWGLSNNNYLIMFRDTALLTDDITTTAQIQALMSGKIMQVQLEVPTLTDMTESEKLTNTYNVNDYGTEEFDNVCALDVLYQNNLVRQIVNNQTAIADHEQRIGALETEVAGIKGLPTAPSTNGNYRLRCTVADGVVTYTWVEES